MPQKRSKGRGPYKLGEPYEARDYGPRKQHDGRFVDTDFTFFSMKDASGQEIDPSTGEPMEEGQLNVDAKAAKARRKSIIDRVRAKRNSRKG